MLLQRYGASCIKSLVSLGASRSQLFLMRKQQWGAVNVLRFSGTATLELPSVSVAEIATYIYLQINGTYDDIYHQLTVLACDVLEYPNDGSLTRVTVSEAKMLIEDVGACPEEFDHYLVDGANSDKSVAFLKQQSIPCHPWEQQEFGDDVDLEVPTMELLKRIDDEPELGMRSVATQRNDLRIKVYAKHGHQPRPFLLIGGIT
eukprot:TRINITY_DN78843_c0_g1_i1.p1 TRINITY_DN78843_c0_g1~~TRINITY_DN78843_c0_g1_i1.p1  ORF type:complete len:203 (+),score=16.55 TRINITY_DN78843_c0_g1_i1:103-711(+)